MTVRPKGKRWQVDRMLGGRRYRETFKTEAEAEQYERDLVHAIESGKPVPKAKTGRTNTGGSIDTLGKLYKHVKRTHWDHMPGSRGTLVFAREVVGMLGEELPVASIDKATVQIMCQRCFDERDNSVATVNRKVSALSRMLTEAVEHGVIARKPVMPRYKEQNVAVKYLTEDVEKRLVTAFQQLGYPHWQHFVPLAIDTGMRLGELLRLRWDHISPDGTIIHIWRTKANRPRSVPLTRRAREALDSMRNVDSVSLGPFVAWAKGADLKRTYRAQWDAACRVAGIQHGIHDLRHTCASRLVQRGIDLLRVKEYLGHSDVKTTLRYAHLAPNNLNACMEALDGQAQPHSQGLAVA